MRNLFTDEKHTGIEQPGMLSARRTQQSIAPSHWHSEYRCHAHDAEKRAGDDVAWIVDAQIYPRQIDYHRRPDEGEGADGTVHGPNTDGEPKEKDRMIARKAVPVAE